MSDVTRRIRPSLLGTLVPLIRQPEPAATRALHYVLEAAPEIASAFVELLTGGRFDCGRIVSEWEFGQVRPDLAIFDTRGKRRLFVENKFWASLTDYQPVAYLKALPSDHDAMLAFIAPEDRTVSLWADLKERCERDDLDITDEIKSNDFCRMRVGKRQLLLTSWRRVLDTLERAASAGGHVTIAQNIVQLRGLTGQMNSDVFLPLRGEEPSDLRVARRMLNYAGLIDSITDSLVTDGVADTKGLRPSGWGRYLRMHARFGLWLHVDLVLWYYSGITPVWTKHNTNSSFSGIEGKLSQAEKMFTDAQETDDGVLCVPIRLKTGVERDRVIDDAVKQMRRVADGLLEVE